MGPLGYYVGALNSHAMHPSPLITHTWGKKKISTVPVYLADGKCTAELTGLF